MQCFNYVGQNFYIATIALLFGKKYHFLSNNINIFMKKIIIKDNLEIFKINLFQNKTILIAYKNKAKINVLIVTLYINNMRTCRKKDLNAYY